MNLPALNQASRYTYNDYLSWDESYRYELIEGVAYALASPNQSHQRVLRKLSNSIDNFLKDKQCELFISPSDVKLAETTVVQPDLFVVCDKAKLDGQFTNGAPDLVIEILSKTTIQKDRVLKYNLYLKAKVKEYWIVDPDNKIVEVLTLTDNKFVHNAYSENDEISSTVIKGYVINMADVFNE